MMRIAAPPELPDAPVNLGGGDNRRRVQARLWQIWLTFLTVSITAWCCTLGTMPAILALVTAKHVLVAILAMGLRLDAPRAHAEGWAS
jgi:hypothetical protein